MGTTTVTAKDVQLLRQRTGAGMMDCKKALEETGGDIDKAVEYLRKKGIAKAEKRADRSASEGAIVALVSDDDHDDEDADVFAVLQPDVSLHANLTRWMRVGVTAGYRLSSGVARAGYDEGDVDGWVVGGHVQFGRF